MKHNLQELRGKINLIDKNILELLKSRFEIAGEIGEIKKSIRLRSGSGGQGKLEKSEIEDREREKELFEVYKRIAEEFELNIEFVKKIFEEIILESKRIQSK